MRADRIVIDTNVLISAALFSIGKPRAVIEQVREANGVLLFSDQTFQEVETRILGRKFDRYVSRDRRETFLVQLEAVSQWVSITDAKLGCRDPDDDKLLETAMMGEADCLVTGDEDLIVMSPFRGIPILRPSEFIVVGQS